MAATAIFRSQDCLRQNPDARPNINLTRNRRLKWSPVAAHFDSYGRDRIDGKHRPRPQKRTSAMVAPTFPSKNFILGQVKILKRGEELPSMSMCKEATASNESRVREMEHLSGEDLVLYSTDRIGPDPETVQKQIRIPELSAYVASPPPSSLPIPLFFRKNEKKNDAASSNLRRLLRLDLL